MRVRLINRRQNFATAQATSYDNIFSEVSESAAPRGIPARLKPTETAQILRPEAFTLGANKVSSKAKTEHACGTPCFQSSAQIITQKGGMSIHDLRASDMVLTRDNGFQPILWVGAVSSPVAAPSLVEIAPDAVLNGAPEAAVCVSTRQSVLLTCSEIQTQFGSAEVLARAGDLLHLEGVSPVERSSEAIAILMPRHELLNVNGLWMDSLIPDGEALEHLSKSDEATIKALLPELGNLPIARSYPTARTVLRAEFARQFTR